MWVYFLRFFTNFAMLYNTFHVFHFWLTGSTKLRKRESIIRARIDTLKVSYESFSEPTLFYPIHWVLAINQMC